MDSIAVMCAALRLSHLKFDLESKDARPALRCEDIQEFPTAATAIRNGDAKKPAVRRPPSKHSQRLLQANGHLT